MMFSVSEAVVYTPFSENYVDVVNYTYADEIFYCKRGKLWN